MSHIPLSGLSLADMLAAMEKNRRATGLVDVRRIAAEFLERNPNYGCGLSQVQETIHRIAIENRWPVQFGSLHKQ